MNDKYRPFGDDFSLTKDDFKVSESYRWVRTGLWLMLISYLLIPLLVGGVVLTFFLMRDQNGVFTGLSGLVYLIFVPLILIYVGCFMLLQTPYEAEKQSIKVFLIWTTLGFVGGIGNWFGFLVAAKFVRSLCSTLGMVYLVKYFKILAVTRGSEKLERSSDHLNRMFLALFFLLIGILLGLPAPLIMTLLVIGVIAFYVVWIRTLWYAIKATEFSELDKGDGTGNARMIPNGTE